MLIHYVVGSLRSLSMTYERIDPLGAISHGMHLSLHSHYVKDRLPNIVGYHSQDNWDSKK